MSTKRSVAKPASTPQQGTVTKWLAAPTGRQRTEIGAAGWQCAVSVTPMPSPITQCGLLFASLRTNGFGIASTSICCSSTEYVGAHRMLSPSQKSSLTFAED